MNDVSKDNLFKNKTFVAVSAVFCTMIWGSTAPVVKVGFDLFKIGSEDIIAQIFFAGLCFTLSGIILLIFPCIKSRRLLIPDRKHINDILFIGLVQTSLQYIFFYIGLSNTTGFKASVLSSSGTFFILIIAHFIYKDDRLNFNKIIGCLVGFMGIVVLSMGTCSEITMDLDFKVLGEGFILLSTLSFVLTTPACKRIGQSIDPTLFTGQSFIIGGIILIAIGCIGGAKIFAVSPIAWLSLLYLGASSAIAGALWNYLLKYNNVAMVSIYNFLVPVFGAIFSSLFLNENILGIRNLIALTMTCLGIVFVNASYVRKNKKGNFVFNS